MNTRTVNPSPSNRIGLDNLINVPRRITLALEIATQFVFLVFLCRFVSIVVVCRRRRRHCNPKTNPRKEEQEEHPPQEDRERVCVRDNNRKNHVTFTMDGFLGYVPKGTSRSHGRNQAWIFFKSLCRLCHGGAILIGNGSLSSQRVRGVFSFSFLFDGVLLFVLQEFFFVGRCAALPDHLGFTFTFVSYYSNVFLLFVCSVGVTHAISIKQ